MDNCICSPIGKVTIFSNRSDCQDWTTGSVHQTVLQIHLANLTACPCLISNLLLEINHKSMFSWAACPGAAADRWLWIGAGGSCAGATAACAAGVLVHHVQVLLLHVQRTPAVVDSCGSGGAGPSGVGGSCAPHPCAAADQRWFFCGTSRRRTNRWRTRRRRILCAGGPSGGELGGAGPGGGGSGGSNTRGWGRDGRDGMEGPRRGLAAGGPGGGKPGASGMAPVDRDRCEGG
jgi:hypothetical protein